MAKASFNNDKDNKKIRKIKDDVKHHHDEHSEMLKKSNHKYSKRPNENRGAIGRGK